MNARLGCSLMFLLWGLFEGIAGCRLLFGCYVIPFCSRVSGWQLVAGGQLVVVVVDVASREAPLREMQNSSFFHSPSLSYLTCIAKTLSTPTPPVYHHHPTILLFSLPPPLPRRER
jgi:hypothetical protein